MIILMEKIKNEGHTMGLSCDRKKTLHLGVFRYVAGGIDNPLK